MFPSQYTRIVFAERPAEYVTPTTFKAEVLPFDLKPGSGQVLVRIIYLSLDPAMRTWLFDRRSYLPPVQIGELMRGPTIGVVVEAGIDSKFMKEDIILGWFGWTEYAVVDDKDATKPDLSATSDIRDFLGPLGHTGLTAYFGLLDVGRVQAGETLVVSAAAGATGSVVCQIGKLKGARVIGIAGSDEKIKWLKKELGVDEALNYKSPTFYDEFDNVVGHLDVFFDNVGGDMLDHALTRLNKHARIVICGQVSLYNVEKPKGLTNTFDIIAQRARLEGFILLDYISRYPEALKDLAKWMKDGRVKRQFHVIEGLENAPDAFSLLFTGGNKGKLIVKVSDLPKA